MEEKRSTMRHLEINNLNGQNNDSDFDVDELAEPSENQEVDETDDSDIDKLAEPSKNQEVDETDDSDIDKLAEPSENQEVDNTDNSENNQQSQKPEKNDENKADNNGDDKSKYVDDGGIDDNGDVYRDGNDLLPNNTYVKNGYIYKTDDMGKIIHCEAKPKLSPENPRNEEAQKRAGGKDRREKDQGGHIIGRDINGDGGDGNLIAMDQRINQSDYKRMENDIKDDLDKGKDVTVSVDILYPDDSNRPDKITVTETTDDGKTVYKFDNNVDGGLMDEVPEIGKELVQKELNDTNGEISSIKEEYNQKGELVETKVTITYIDDNGINRRTQVNI